jgi:hypothetical protein
LGNILRHTGVGAASLLASAATRSALEGSSFGDNIMAGLPDVIGQVVGRAIGGKITDASKRVHFKREAERLRALPGFDEASDDSIRRTTQLIVDGNLSVKEIASSSQGLASLAETHTVLNATSYAGYSSSDIERITANGLRHVVGAPEGAIADALQLFRDHGIYPQPRHGGEADVLGGPADITVTGAYEDGFAHGSLIDPVMIGSGKLAETIGREIAERPALKYGLIGLQIAAGPAVYAAQQALAASPAGRALDAGVQAAADYIGEGFTAKQYMLGEARHAGVGGVTLASLAIGGFTQTLRAFKTLGFQDHHIISPTNRATRNHPLLGLAGYDLQGRANRMLLPSISSAHPTRSIHRGRHDKAYSEVLRDRMNEIVERGRAEGFSQADYRRELDALVAWERAALRSGDRALNKNGRPWSNRVGR